MISESMDKEFIQCLVILLSCFASWLEAVNSSSLIGSGFGYRYSATELLVMLDNFILSKENYDKIVETSSSDIINFLTSLITNAGNTEKKYACIEPY